ncbi:tRNA 2-thiouridine(34) synthase MnmA [uncultured Draconibacterium sp.]|uniref:tRNA 2-thiouridine(34) synthase MnmA n=1 Tax=uncultured Draconibacterium sp. TaxID=1573823 RepID=UPI003260500C
MNKRVLLGMSGGIDSSVAAMLLQEQGYTLIGITFIFSGTDADNHHFLNDARTLARHLNIEHLTIDLRAEFEEIVVRYFIKEYTKGNTPFPCAYCNPVLKFHYLNKYAVEYKCNYIATGHYVRTGYFNQKKYLYQGLDPDKDQAFFLWGLKREIVDKLIFPLGEFNKIQIRSIAKEKGFYALSEKKDSLGICFIEGNDYRKFLEKRGVKSKPGNFVDPEGKVLGKHQGIFNYTIGQRRGLGLNYNFPLFVAEIRLDDNEIVLAKYEELYRTKILIENYYVIDKEIVKQGVALHVKVRYRLQLTACKLNILSDTETEVELLEPEAMIAPGQTAVLFHDERLIGGGFIKSSK